MALAPLTVELSNGQKLEVLKRFYKLYRDELTKVEDEMRDIMIALKEHEFVVQYLGDQPEVSKLAARKDELDKLAKRREHIGKLIERLEGSIPKQGSEAPATIQRY